MKKYDYIKYKSGEGVIINLLESGKALVALYFHYSSYSYGLSVDTIDLNDITPVDFEVTTKCLLFRLRNHIMRNGGVNNFFDEELALIHYE